MRRLAVQVRSSRKTKILKFLKIKIAVLALISSLVGFAISPKETNPQKLLTFLIGLFLLSLGSLSLNNIQDRKIDEKMERTKGRKIPKYGAIISVSLLTLGMIIIPHKILGGITVILYNGIYTYLKRISPLAFLPGSFIGVMPPLMGYIEGGGKGTTVEIIFLLLFFFLWQIPHFLVIALQYASDYERAGIPSILRIVSEDSAKRILKITTIITLIITLPFFELGEILIISPQKYGFSPILAILFVDLVSEKDPKRIFFGINIYTFLFSIFVIMKNI